MDTEPRASPNGRHLIVIDIENLTASPDPTPCQLDAALTALGRSIPGFHDDQQVVACSHRAAKTVAFAFPAARQIWRSGPDGADLALLKVLRHERVAERYGRVTICSGDGIFATAAARPAEDDVDVTVVSLRGHLAARLQLAARHVIFLPITPTADALGSCA